MKKLIVIIFLLSSLPLYAIAFLPSPAGGNALDLSGGKQGYYYAEDINNSFDGDFLKKGFTIEFWFCPARVTNVGEGWNLIAKRPFYGIELAYFGYRFGEEGVQIRFPHQGGHNTTGYWDLSSKERYEPKWHHIIFQSRVYGKELNGIDFFDGEFQGSGGGSSSDFIIDNDEPLCVGGFPEGYKTSIYVDGNYEIVDAITFDGLIDELRISNIERYKANDKIDINKRLDPDEHTVALWHFDEGINQPQYEDASGNGHTLFASGFGNITGVNQRQILPVLWGNIKK